MSSLPDSPPNSTQSADKSAPPWNPRRIWQWGLFCGPYWTSLMAGLNILRLGQKRWTIWPVLIVLFSFILAFVDPFLWMYRAPTWLSYFYQTFLSFGAMGALWFLELNGQKEPFDLRTQETRGARFRLPVVLGLLPGLQLWAYFLLTPAWLLTMPTPTQVCEKFFLEDDPEVVRPYCTVNMYQTIDLLTKVRGLNDHVPASLPEAATGPGSTFQLERENIIPDKPGRRRIDMKFYFVDSANSETMLFDGFFEVQYLDDMWRIDELFFTHMDHQELSQGKIRFEEFLKLMLEQQNAPQPDQQINQEPAPEEASVAEYSMMTDGTGVPVLMRHIVPRHPYDVAALKPAVVTPVELATTPKQVAVETPKKKKEAKPFPIPPFHQWKEQNQKYFTRAVLILVFFVLPAIWRFVFKSSSSPVTRSSAEETDPPSV